MHHGRTPLVFGSLVLSLACSAAGDGETGSLGMGHGVARLELHRGAGQVDDPFLGTAQVEATLVYEDCLIDFYEANPTWRQGGPDGDAVFDASLDAGLCDPSDPELAHCTVVSLVQELDVGGFLRVTYAVTGPLEGRVLRFGPLPSEELAACAAGALPLVRINSVRGLDETGMEIWTTQSFDPVETAADVGLPSTIHVTHG